MSSPLTKQELHYLAMNIVGKDLEKRGFEFIAINSSLGKNPQFVCIDKNNERFFVIVKAILQPDNPNNYNLVWMEKFKEHAREHKAKVLYAGVGLANSEDATKPIFKGEEYLLEYNGIQVIDTTLN